VGGDQRSVALCRTPSIVHGAGACPREAGHPGEHFWWIPFILGESWRVVVYSGDPYDRVTRCRGAFVREPDCGDVFWLLNLIAELRRRNRR
jgi:hypothetical protein